MAHQSSTQEQTRQQYPTLGVIRIIPLLRRNERFTQFEILLSVLNGSKSAAKLAICVVMSHSEFCIPSYIF